MFQRKYNELEIPIDVLRMIVNKSRKYSLIILINGHGQVGKSTFIWYLANRIMQIKRHGRLSAYNPRNTWREWDGRGNSADNAFDFVNVWDKNREGVCVLQEVSETLNRYEWWNVMGKVFNSTTTTQGLKHNICLLDTVMSTDIMKNAKEKVDFRMWVARRIDPLRLAVIKDGWIEINYLKDKWRLRWLPNWDIFYTPKQLAMSQVYTDWLAMDLKSRIVEKNKRLVGMLPSLKEEELAHEAAETHRILEEQRKNPVKMEIPPFI